MEKLQCYFFEEDLETSNSEEQNEKWVCEMNYEECNRKGYCNGDC
jgi:hypothetical protein